MNSVKIMQIIGFGFLFIAFALAYNGNSTNPNCFDADAETCDAAAQMLKAKRELSDAPTILVYIAIAAVIVIPQIPQLDV
jgi:hypothetical protein